MNFRHQTAIKGQVLANFIVKFTYFNATKVTRMANSTKTVKATGVREKDNFIVIKGDAKQWTLYVDDTSNDTGSGAGMMLISLE